MTDQKWNATDYLFVFPDIPSYEGDLVEAPFMHKVNWVWRYIFDDVLPEISRAINAGAELAALTLALATVDYMAGYRVGRESNGKDYVNFLREYFPSEYTLYIDDIYSQLRNGIMHNLVTVNPWRKDRSTFSIHERNSPHLTPDDAAQIAFSVPIFLEDIRRAWIMFVHELVMHPTEGAKENFLRRFNRLDGTGAFMRRSLT